MCEYCGCQAVASIDQLTTDHATVVNLIGHVLEAHRDGDPARMAETARRIAAVLEPHTRVEEHGLFPALADDFPDQLAALEDEHRRIEGALAEAADGTPVDPGWAERLKDVLALLHEHIRKEQDGVFPAALAYLSTEQWEAVEAVRARVGPRMPHPSG